MYVKRLKQGEGKKYIYFFLELYIHTIDIYMYCTKQVMIHYAHDIYMY